MFVGNPHLIGLLYLCRLVLQFYMRTNREQGPTMYSGVTYATCRSDEECLWHRRDIPGRKCLKGQRSHRSCGQMRVLPELNSTIERLIGLFFAPHRLLLAAICRYNGDSELARDLHALCELNLRRCTMSSFSVLSPSRIGEPEYSLVVAPSTGYSALDGAFRYGSAKRFSYDNRTMESAMVPFLPLWPYEESITYMPSTR